MQMRQNDIKLLSILCIALMAVCTVGMVIDSQESEAVTDLGTYDGTSNYSSTSAAYSNVMVFDPSVFTSSETVYVLVGSTFGIDGGSKFDTPYWTLNTFDPAIKDNSSMFSLALKGSVSTTGTIATAVGSHGITITFIGIENTTPVSSISISGSSSVDVGDSVSLSASVSPSNADDTSVTWSIESVS